MEYSKVSYDLMIFTRVKLPHLEVLALFWHENHKKVL